jgi:signal transduction histidine kinase
MQSVDNFIQRALNSRYSTSSDFPEPSGMIKSSMVSEPIINHGIHLWNLFSIAPHTLSHDVNILFEQQNYFSTVMIIIVGIVALATVLLIMLWNKELESTVKARTMELKKTNKYLVAANEQLKINDKLHNEFINIASHEMKTPTQSILLHSSLLSQSYYDDNNNS